MGKKQRASKLLSNLRYTVRDVSTIMKCPSLDTEVGRRLRHMRRLYENVRHAFETHDLARALSASDALYLSMGSVLLYLQ
jgi:uncharacterized membrane protein